MNNLELPIGDVIPTEAEWRDLKQRDELTPRSFDSVSFSLHYSHCISYTYSNPVSTVELTLGIYVRACRSDEKGKQKR